MLILSCTRHVQTASGVGVPSTVVVPVVQAPASSSAFPGLYCTAFVESPFLSECAFPLLPRGPVTFIVSQEC